MDETFVKTIVNAFKDGLDKAANDILDKAEQLADKNAELRKLKDEMEGFEAAARSRASTEKDDDTGKLVYPNITSQDARVRELLDQLDKYQIRKTSYLELLTVTEKCKAKIHRLEQERGDAKAQADYRVGLLTP